MILPIQNTTQVFAAESINLWRGSRRILHDVSLTLTPGECVAIVGPNGAGKSSLLKVFSGDLRPASGDITLNKMPLPAWNRRELARQRAVLPQQSDLIFPFPVRDVVLMGRAPYHGGIETEEDFWIADEAMEATDVAHFQDRPYDQLSGGEKQRVQLARVLAQVWPRSSEHGGFLLLDEPTASLDLSHQHAFLSTVQRFSRSGLGVLVVLHDLNLALQYADRVMVMYHGHSVACDVPSRALIPELVREVFNVDVRILCDPAFAHPVLIPFANRGR